MMNSDWLSAWLGNPIFVKHLRSRMRTQPLISSIVVVQVLCICIAWGGFQLDAFRSGGALTAYLVLQVVLLGIIGASQVSTSVGGARASGILDFHRVSPLSPTEMTLGFFFGAPVREYILFASTLPYLVLCVAMGTPDLRGLIQLMTILIVTCWMLQGISLLSALSVKNQAGSRGIIGIVVFVMFLGGPLMGGLSRAARFVEQEPRLSFFGISLPWLPVVLLFQLPFLFFVFLASRRKMDSERLHPLTKPQAIAAMATLGLLMVGGVWKIEDAEVFSLVILYALVAASIILTLMVTPNQAEYYKGLWRAQKAGRSRPSPWDDMALNRLFLVVVCSLLLITSTLAWNSLKGLGTRLSPNVTEAFPLAIANGVLVAAYFGLAHQFFLLRFGRRGGSLMGLFLFLIWIVPLVAGTILIFANSLSNERPAQVVFALSPLAGIGLTAMATENTMAIQAAALIPTLLFTFLANTLVTQAARRVRKAVIHAAGKGPSKVDSGPVGAEAPGETNLETGQVQT